MSIDAVLDQGIRIQELDNQIPEIKRKNAQELLSEINVEDLMNRAIHPKTDNDIESIFFLRLVAGKNNPKIDNPEFMDKVKNSSEMYLHMVLDKNNYGESKIINYLHLYSYIKLFNSDLNLNINGENIPSVKDKEDLDKLYSRPYYNPHKTWHLFNYKLLFPNAKIPDILNSDFEGLKKEVNEILERSLEYEGKIGSYQLSHLVRLRLLYGKEFNDSKIYERYKEKIWNDLPPNESEFHRLDYIVNLNLLEADDLSFHPENGVDFSFDSSYTPVQIPSLPERRNF